MPVKSPASESKSDLNHLLHLTRPFAHASNATGVWQVASTLSLLILTLWVARLLGPHWERFLLVLPMIGLLVRTFVLQHDCGHLSLFDTNGGNDRCGYLLSWFTGVPYEAWRSEHNWHHNNQGKLDRRGVDRMNSPMTSSEAQLKPDAARLRSKTISPFNIFVLGFLSLVIQRKRAAGFFFYRPKYVWSIPNEKAFHRSFWITLPGYFVVHALIIAWLGWATWAGVFALAFFLGGGLASWLFWVQHNFERTYHASGDEWEFALAAIRGSSYLRLPQPLRYFTADIGTHHVHHLNPRIPNHLLEAARVAIPQALAVLPLRWIDLRRSFSHVFWDESSSRMASLAELHLPPEPVPEPVLSSAPV